MKENVTHQNLCNAAEIVLIEKLAAPKAYTGKKDGLSINDFSSCLEKSEKEEKKHKKRNNKDQSVNQWNGKQNDQTSKMMEKAKKPKLVLWKDFQNW